MMKFEITMKEMKDVVKKIEKSVMKKAALPILETVLVKQENDQLAFIASNIEEELHIYKDVLVTGNDSFCITLDSLKKIVKLKANELTVKYDMDDKKVFISTGNKVITFTSGWNTKDFPLMENDEPKEIFFVSDYKNYTDIMNKLSVYLERSEEYNLAKCCYNFNAEKNRITALDGYRMGMCNPSKSVGQFNNNLDVKEINLKREFWIKLKNCIAKKTKGEQNCVYMSSTEKKTYISGNDFMMIVKNADIKYFDIDHMILNKSDLMTVKLDTTEMKESSEYNAALYDYNDRKPMYVKFIGNDVITYMRTDQEESFDKITSMENCVKDRFIIAFNPMYMKDLYNGCDSNAIEMGFHNSKSPVMVWDGDFSYLVLPVYLNNEEEITERIYKLMKDA